MSNEDEKNAFSPMLYYFRVPPIGDMNKGFSLQQPFAVLFDNLIAVLWSIYGKDSKIKVGINQIQWALELMKCMRVDFSYPEGISIIVNKLEEQLLALYAKVGKKLEEIREKQEEDEKNEAEENNSQSTEARRIQNLNCLSYNEKDVMDKLDTINIPTVTIVETGELKLLKELNSLGRRKNKEDEACKIDKKTSKTFIIGTLQKILDKTTEVQTKSDVEELLKELKVKKSNMPEATKSTKSTNK